MSKFIDGTESFYYNGKIYLSHTEIKVSDEYIKSHSSSEKPIWPYAYFTHRFMVGNVVYYVFSMCRLDLFGEWRKYAGDFIVRACDIDQVVGEILTKNAGIEIDFSVYSNEKASLLKMGLNQYKPIHWLIYISVMIGSLVFNQFYIIWIIASLIFFLTGYGVFDK